MEGHKATAAGRLLHTWTVDSCREEAVLICKYICRDPGGTWNFCAEIPSCTGKLLEVGDIQLVVNMEIKPKLTDYRS